jgi:two-component system chemotaxis response regulator CheB
MRKLLADTLGAGGVDVVGTAANGDEALGACLRLRPDVLTLDLEMPGLDGIGVLRTLRDAASPIPVIVVSSFSPAHGARAVDALAEGAVELVVKPVAGDPADRFAGELVGKVTAAAGSAPRHLTQTDAIRRDPAGQPATGTRRAVVVACSTGGPRALAELLPMLPGELGNGTLIVQHMPPGFTGSLAQRLDRACALTVQEAADGDVPAAETALVAPGGRHLRLDPTGRVRLTDDPEVGGLRPRADLTIADAARVHGDRLLLVVLTGMGRDGLQGAQAVRRAGGRVLVEAASTCTVYGMPRAVSEARLADAELPLGELAAAISEEAG